jgi:hypothetical protein
MSTVSGRNVSTVLRKVHKHSRPLLSSKDRFVVFPVLVVFWGCSVAQIHAVEFQE